MENIPQKEPNDSEPEIKKYRNKKKRYISMPCFPKPDRRYSTKPVHSLELSIYILKIVILINKSKYILPEFQFINGQPTTNAF